MTTDAPIFGFTMAAGDVISRQQILCAHCSLPVPAGLIEPDTTRQFCCTGCRAVYETLHACGLEAYYKLRDLDDAPASPAKPSDATFAELDSSTFDQLYVEHQTNGLAYVDLLLEGITCAACVWLVERLPHILSGVVEARLSMREATVRLTWNPTKIALSRIARALDKLGYTPHPAKGSTAKELHRRETRRRIVQLGVAGALMGNIMLLAFGLYSGDAGHMEHQYRELFRWLSGALGLISLAWPGGVFFRGAWAAIKTRAASLDLPIALALAVGGVAGIVNVIRGQGEIYFDSLSVLVLLLLVGRFLQYRQQRRADDAVGLLFNLTPSHCRVVRGDQVIDAPVEALQINDLIEVRPGELFPADGVVEIGSSSVNQALLTGESMPTSVTIGHTVFGSSQNVESVLRVRVSHVGQSTRVGQLMRLVERGASEKPPVVQFADKVSRIFLVLLILASVVTFAFWFHRGVERAIDHSVALLIVACPCVLGLATPLTISIAIGRLARRDVLVKSGAALERLAKGGSLLLDKTGTLTEGRLQLLRWIGDESIKPEVAELERTSNHPVGKALRRALLNDNTAAPVFVDLVERGDGGVSGKMVLPTLNSSSHKRTCLLEVGSISFAVKRGTIIPAALQETIDELLRAGSTNVVVSVDGTTVAVAALADQVRQDCATSIARLRQLGWKPRILSGDGNAVVQEVAAQVGIEGSQAWGQLLPEDKLRRVSERKAPGVTVMVGDGVNDAAALAAADVGVAVHGGAEASLVAADVYIARPGVGSLVELVEMSRRTVRVIHRNLAVSLSYNLVAGALAATGQMTPLLAAIIMPISSATVLALAIFSITRGRTAARGKEGLSWK